MQIGNKYKYVMISVSVSCVIEKYEWHEMY